MGRKLTTEGLERALRRAPRTIRWLMARNYAVADCPAGTVAGRMWIDGGHHVVYFIPPERISKRWREFLAVIHPLGELSNDPEG